MTVTTSNARQILFRLGESARLPEAMLGILRDEVVLAGWMRASGVLYDVRIRGLGGSASGVRTLAGPVHVIVLDGSIGLSQGDVTCGLRAVVSRETDTGLETVAGEIIEARVGGLEVMVTAFDDVTAGRQAGPAGVWLLDPTNVATAAAPVAAAPAPVRVAAAAAAAAPPPPPPPPPPPSEPSMPPPVSEPEVPKAAPPKPSPTFSSSSSMPQRIVKPAAPEEEEQVVPDAGDVVEHFAFGRCEVVKSDGDRLHLRLPKDGRVKEIALEMLKVTPLAPVDGQSGQHFKLDRKL